MVDIDQNYKFSHTLNLSEGVLNTITFIGLNENYQAVSVTIHVLHQDWATTPPQSGTGSGGTGSGGNVPGGDNPGTGVTPPDVNKDEPPTLVIYGYNKSHIIHMSGNTITLKGAVYDDHDGVVLKINGEVVPVNENGSWEYICEIDVNKTGLIEIIATDSANQSSQVVLSICNCSIAPTITFSKNQYAIFGDVSDDSGFDCSGIQAIDISGLDYIEAINLYNAKKVYLPLGDGKIRIFESSEIEVKKEIAYSINLLDVISSDKITIDIYGNHGQHITMTIDVEKDATHNILFFVITITNHLTGTSSSTEMQY
jgi:hypothetical protein